MPAKDSRGKVVNHNYSQRSYNKAGYQSFEDFYPFYLGEHCNTTNRRLHLVATTNAVVLLAMALMFQAHWLILVGMVQGYAFAWVGHFFFEKNKPATFSHPIYSFMGDFRMWWEVITGLRAF